MTKNTKTLIRILCTTAILIIALIIKYATRQSLFVQIALFAVGYVVIGYDIVSKAVKRLFHGKVLDENFLMTIATIGAFAIGEYPDAVAVMLLYQIGELFQRYAVGKSRQNIASLAEIRPETATLFVDNTETEVHPSQVNIGDVFVVKAGDKIPLDGQIIDGQCSVNTSAITGESLPQSLQKGDKVISGCISLDGVIYVKATSTYDDSTVAKILDLVENATANKAPAENFITQFSKYYTPIVVILAVIIGVVPPLFVNLWTVWLKRAMMFLFVSCPCALVISVPLGFFGGISSASKNGILIKGSNYLELLAKADVIAFDKTGTLTEGNLQVVDVYPSQNKDYVLQLASIAEQYSHHPIAQAICKLQQPNKNATVTEIAGCGLVAKTVQNTILCGNGTLMKQHNVKHPVCADYTAVYVACDGIFVGYVALADKVKEDAKHTVDSLKTDCQIIMLTGDNEQTAKQVAQKLGIEDYYSQLLPQQKTETLDRYKQNGHTVAFVGDGINDAPVLATADVSIAMGKGSDIAIETADIVLMHDNPHAIVKAKRIARKTLKTVRQNIVFSLLVKFAVLILSAIGVLDMLAFGMVVAILADVGVCIVAVLNSMRTMIYKNS